jgi:hypothetical protein
LILWINSRLNPPLQQSEEVDLPEEKIPDNKQSHMPIDDYTSVLSFVMTKDRGIDIEMKWSDESEQTAKDLALMLSFVHNGYLKKNNLTIISDIPLENPDLEPFVSDVISQWVVNEDKIIAAKGILSTNTIKPSEVFRIRK